MTTENASATNTSILNTADPAPAGDAAPAGDPAPASFVEEGWLKGVETDIVNDPAFKAIKDLPSLAKSYVHAQRLIGKEKVVIPNEKSTDQDWKNFYSKIGLPAEESYALDINPEESVLGKEAVEQFKKIAYENNLLPKQATQALKFVEQTLADRNKAQAEQADEILKQELAGLQEEWGNDYPLKMHQAKRVINMFGDDNFKKYMDDSGLGSDVNFIKLMNKIGASLKEDNFQTDVVGHLGISRDDAQRQVDSIFGDVNGPYYDINHPAHTSTVDKVNKLFKVLSGEA